ncbi:DUF5719 family protein [Rhizohabitans arisaemae]|uniref:DUF5719 family protein n=1 Tax=Rhizohabitans arisaemae TaxID=2720610 RepID=UPI0024B09F0E|nr:DUF5719 family protein [Rhizohabitans arisaemae]
MSRQRKTGLVGNRFGLFGLVVVAMIALYGAARISQPEVPEWTPPPVLTKVAVESVRTVCPDLFQGRTAVLTPAGAGTGNGRAEIRGIGQKTPLAVVESPGRMWVKDLKGLVPALTVSATGVMASGLEVGQLSRVVTGVERGLAGLRCIEPGTSTWFVGPGPSAADVTLHLTNADTVPAMVGFAVYSGEGPVLTESTQGMTVEPGKSRIVRLRDLAPSADAAAVQVSTTSGRIAAAARVAYPGDKGVDWIPPAVEPNTTVIVPAVPKGGGLRRLYVTAPGDKDTVVRIKVVTSDSMYTPKGHERIDVPAGSTVVTDLTTALAGQAGALQLSADVPIVAGMMSTGTGAKQDVAFSAASPSIDLGSVTLGNRGPSRLVLSAPLTNAKVSVQVIPARGAPLPAKEVEVPVHRTVQVDIPAPRGSEGAYAIVVNPVRDSGPVYGGRVLEERTPEGQLITIQPLAMARTWALVPQVVDTMIAAIPPAQIGR